MPWSEKQARNQSGLFPNTRNDTKQYMPVKQVKPPSVKRGSNSKKHLRRSRRNDVFQVSDDNMDLERLETYQKLHGNCDVPILLDHTDKTLFNSGARVHNHHDKLRKMNILIQDEHRVAKLNGKPNDWGKMFERLLLYQKEHGNTRVPKSYVDSAGYNLGTWVHNQRFILPKMKDSVLRDDRIERLSNIQFEWRIVTNINDWDTMYERLLLYQKDHGDTRVSQSYVDEAGYKLGRWVSTQRLMLPKMKDSALREERIEKLNKIQFEWIIRKVESWDTMYERLLLYQKEHGDTRVPQWYVDGASYKLGIWVKSQRQSLPKMKDSVLRDERIKKLNGIYFEWSNLNKNFCENIEYKFSWNVSATKN